MADEASFPGLVFHENGLSVTRVPSSAFPEVPASLEPVDGISSKDVVVNESLGISLRAYFPVSGEDSPERLPLVVYCHGGGFILFSCKSFPFHKFCEKIAKELKAIVLSVEYRLAPEHRLPAAYDDTFHILTWLEMISKQAPAADGADDSSDFANWLKIHADFSKVFLAGDSAGGNISYHVARKWCSAVSKTGKNNKMLSLVGLVLIQPFFGGVSRTESEISFGGGPVITIGTSDLCWKYSLPVGTDRDHPFCNVYKNLEGVADLPRVMVVSGGTDLLHDRQVQLVKLLKQAQKDVVFVDYDKVGHAFYMVPASPEVSRFFEDLVAFCNNIA